MKIVGQEVKTLYTIELSVSDIAEAMSDYCKSTNKHKYPRAFDWLTMDTEAESWTLKKVEEIINKTFFMASNGDTYSYLAEYFGFDGWSNAGLWKENKRIYTMSVFNRGEYLK